MIDVAEKFFFKKVKDCKQLLNLLGHFISCVCGL